MISGIESRNIARIRRLVSDSYNDKWDFDADDVAEAVVDVGSQFMTLVLTLVLAPRVLQLHLCHGVEKVEVKK